MSKVGWWLSCRRWRRRRRRGPQHSGSCSRRRSGTGGAPARASAPSTPVPPPLAPAPAASCRFTVSDAWILLLTAAAARPGVPAGRRTTPLASASSVKSPCATRRKPTRASGSCGCGRERDLCKRWGRSFSAPHAAACRAAAAPPRRSCSSWRRPPPSRCSASVRLRTLRYG